MNTNSPIFSPSSFEQLNSFPRDMMKSFPKTETFELPLPLSDTLPMVPQIILDPSAPKVSKKRQSSAIVSSSSSSDELIQEKKAKRARNKVSAAQYRKRRKQHVEDLEKQVNQLTSTVSSQGETIVGLQTANKLLKEQLDFVRSFFMRQNPVAKTPTPVVAPTVTAPAPSLPSFPLNFSVGFNNGLTNGIANQPNNMNGGLVLFALFSVFLLSGTTPSTSTNSGAQQTYHGRTLLSLESRSAPNNVVFSAVSFFLAAAVWMLLARYRWYKSL